MRKAILGLLALTVAVPAMTATAAAQGYQDDGRYERDYRDDGYEGEYRDGGYDRDSRYERGDRYDRDSRYDRRDRRHARRYARYYNQRGYYSGPTWRGRDGRHYCHRSDGSAGLLIGGVAGALVGRSVDTRGDRTGGTILGAVAGALLGNEIDRGGNRGRRCR